MRKNTVKPGLTRDRATRVVENDTYAAFVGRVLRAYARRVGAGDVEALRTLVQLRVDIDAVVGTAVAGLRGFGYTWSEIAARLGVTRQAAQMRYGDPAERGALDRRLLRDGLGVSVATLVEVFADHHPGSPVPSTCAGCGFPYPDGETECPTLATVRPLLYRRRTEDQQAIDRLNRDQFADLYRRRAAPGAGRRAARPVGAQIQLDLTPEVTP